MTTLFDHPIARETDPATSHEAAEALTAGGKRHRMMAVALAGLTAHPGLTAKELELKLGYSDGAVRKRLTDLLHRGLARTGADRACTITGKRAQTWWAAAE